MFLSHFVPATLPPPRVLKSILYICVFIPVLPLGSSEPFFFLIPYICVDSWGFNEHLYMGPRVGGGLGFKQKKVSLLLT